MFPGMYGTALQVETNHHEPAADNLEEYAQKHGFVTGLPTLSDRLALRVGQLLITMGQRLTTASTKNLQLSKDLR